MSPLAERAAGGWPQGWTSIDDAIEGRRIVAELTAEVPRGHALSGAPVTPLARRSDTDDVLFALSDGRVAQVHLTWRKQTDPAFPWTELHACLDDWVRAIQSAGPAA